MRSQTRAHLASLQPVEVVLPRAGLSSTTRKLLLGSLRHPRVNELPRDKFLGIRMLEKELEEQRYEPCVLDTALSVWPCLYRVRVAPLQEQHGPARPCRSLSRRVP